MSKPAAEKQTLSLSEQVTQTLELYFDTLQEQTTCDLYEMVIHQVEKPMLEFVLAKTEYNQTQTALILGINRNTLRTKMQKHQLI